MKYRFQYVHENRICKKKKKRKKKRVYLAQTGEFQHFPVTLNAMKMNQQMRKGGVYANYSSLNCDDNRRLIERVESVYTVVFEDLIIITQQMV